MARVPSYRLHKATGLAVVTINGSDVYLGKHGTKESKSAYKKLIAEYEAVGRRTSYRASHVTIAMLISDYLDFASGYYPKSGNSEATQARVALKYLMPYASESANDFGPLRLKAVREEMLKGRRKRDEKPFSRQYVNKMTDRIVRAFRWAAESELVEVTTYQSLKNVKGLQRGRSSAPEAERVRLVEHKRIDAVLVECTEVVADMIRVQYLTGMRPGEVVSLTPEMIDRSGDIWLAELPEHKTRWRGKDRTIYIGPQAQAVLAKYLLRGADTPCFSPSESEEQRRASKERMTPENQGNRRGYSDRSRSRARPRRKVGDSYTTASYGKSVRYACERAYPVPDGSTKEETAGWRKRWWWSPNQLRHNAATKVRKEYGLEAAQVVLGHSTANTTEIYAERDQSLGLRIAAAIG